MLRTDDHPNGLPHLSPLHAAKVAAANLLYDQTQILCRLCVEHGVLFSIENPARSFMWQTTHMAKFLEEVAPIKPIFITACTGLPEENTLALSTTSPRFAI